MPFPTAHGIEKDLSKGVDLGFFNGPEGRPHVERNEPIPPRVVRNSKDERRRTYQRKRCN